MADVERLLGRGSEGATRRSEAALPVDAEEWYGYLAIKRQTLIQELREVERVLVRANRLKGYSLPQKIRD